MPFRRKRKVIYPYKIHFSLYDTICFYCGALGESKDHVPPLSYAEHLEEENRLLIKSCLLCNGLLGNRALLTLLSRCDYLFIAYQRRFKKLLSMPPWQDHEILELKGSLKRSIILGIKKKTYIENKLLYLRKNIIALQGYE